jgi:hypothetical protein
MKRVKKLGVWMDSILLHNGITNNPLRLKQLNLS